jgi:hypothetical protein
MKKTILYRGLAVSIVLLVAGAALAGEAMKSASGWFDFENCAFCKNLMAEEGLLEHTTWETHPIRNGMITIMTVAPGYAAAMDKAEKAMNDIGMKIQNGEVNPMTMKMCGHCQNFGMLMMGGKVNMEEVRGDAARVSLTTSDDPATVKQLQDMAERNTREMALMMGDHGHGEHPEGGHKGEHPKGHGN